MRLMNSVITFKRTKRVLRGHPIIRRREPLLRSGMSSIGFAMTRSEVAGRGAEVTGLVEQVIPVLNLDPK
jgi:hypothetical protein